MSNIIEFPIEDIIYITGNTDKCEPPIVGVKCKGISIQLSCDLHNVLLGDIEVKREELIAFILATGIHHDFTDIKDETTQETIMYAVSEIDENGRIEEIKMFDNIKKARELKAALDDSLSFSKSKLKHEIFAHEYKYGYRV